MSQEELIRAALDQTIDEIPSSPARSRVSGKVRDVFALSANRLALVATDRISVFDYVIGSRAPADECRRDRGPARYMTLVAVLRRAGAYWWSMIFSENRCTLFGIMLYRAVDARVIE
jgi:hypothetical protein